FASYIVVLKDGKQYKAKAKWTVQNGKALVQLENGQSLLIDPALIDEAKSEQTTKLGLGDVRIMNLDAKMPDAPGTPKSATPSLGEQIRLRKLSQQTAAPQAAPAPVAPVPSADGVSSEVLDKFERAYE